MPYALIIDDEPNIRRMVGALLAAEGFDVGDAADGSSGVAKAIQADPDVILLDLMMPGGMDGMATLQALREKLPDVPRSEERRVGKECRSRRWQRRQLIHGRRARPS